LEVNLEHTLANLDTLHNMLIQRKTKTRKIRKEKTPTKIDKRN